MDVGVVYVTKPEPSAYPHERPREEIQVIARTHEDEPSRAPSDTPVWIM
jgi:hypothetical protein